MRSLENTKTRIGNILKLYKGEFPQDYKDCVEAIAEKRRLNNNDIGEVKGDHVFKRKIVEIPEMFWTMLHQSLDAEELEWFYEKENQRWFAKTYPEFKGSDQI